MNSKDTEVSMKHHQVLSKHYWQVGKIIISYLILSESPLVYDNNNNNNDNNNDNNFYLAMGHFQSRLSSI